MYDKKLIPLTPVVGFSTFAFNAIPWTDWIYLSLSNVILITWQYSFSFNVKNTEASTIDGFTTLSTLVIFNTDGLETVPLSVITYVLATIILSKIVSAEYFTEVSSFFGAGS